MNNQQRKRCLQCGLQKYSPCPNIKGRGNHLNPVIIMIGEAPGPDEARKGIAFVGRAGKKLTDMLNTVPGLTSHHYFITNMVRCFPPKYYDDPLKAFRPPSAEEIELCRPILKEEIEFLFSNTKGPRILMPMGNIALTGIFGSHKGITKEIGIPRQIEGYTILPNFHPSYILRNPSKELQFIATMFEATKILGVNK